MLGWLLVARLVARFALVAAPAAATFVVVTALAAACVEDPLWLGVIGAAAAAMPAMLLTWRLGAALQRRGRRPLGVVPIAAFVNVAITALLALGFADDVGRALRRHGDWFMGERNGFVVRHARAAIALAAGALERVDPPLVAVAASAGPAPPLWQHPLAGPRRVLPENASMHFGAARPQPRPTECELGHCGVDLVDPFGTPVHAVSDGVVDRIERDEHSDAISGRYLILSHQGGAVRSRYIHLDSVAAELRVGDHVVAGQVVGVLGRTGIEHSVAHLHFALSRVEGGRERFIDPEPYLAQWALPSGGAAIAALGD